MKDSKKFYEKFHRKAGVRKSVIKRSNLGYRHVLDALEPFFASNIKFLDVGCGGGDVVLYAASKGIDSTGIDISENAIMACRKSAVNIGLESKATFFSGLLEKLDLPKDQFDLVLCNQVIEHIEDHVSFLRVLRSVMRNSGNGIITVPADDAPVHRLRKAIFGRDRFDEQVGHLRRYSKENFKATLELAGFFVLSIYSMEGPLRSYFYIGPCSKFLRKTLPHFLVKLLILPDVLLLRFFPGGAHFALVSKVNTE